MTLSFKVYSENEFHPHTLQHLRRGHPWVTLDSFSEKLFFSESFFRESCFCLFEQLQRMGLPVSNSIFHSKILKSTNISHKHDSQKIKAISAEIIFIDTLESFLSLKNISTISLTGKKKEHNHFLQKIVIEQFSNNTKNIEEKYLLLIDPFHPYILGRVLGNRPSLEGIDNSRHSLNKNIPIWKSYLEMAIEEFLKRKCPLQHFSLVNQENSNLPGLEIIFSTEFILFRVYHFYWLDQLELLVTILKESFILRGLYGKYEKSFSLIYMQINHPLIRSLNFAKWDVHKMKWSFLSFENALVYTSMIEENQLKMILKLSSHYRDIGVFHDLAPLRFMLSKFWEKKFSINTQWNCLNLFSYTGIFSLLARKFGAITTSVDVSKTYLGWEKENSSLNQQDINIHEFISQDCEDYLKKLIKRNKDAKNATEQKYFDFIICDPPTRITQKKRFRNSIQQYEDLIPLCQKVLKNRGYLLAIHNTHQKSSQTLKKILEKNFFAKGNQSNIEDWSPQFYSHFLQTIPTFKNFPEGQYLKIFLVSVTK